MERRRDLQFQALAPEGVVVAVDAQHVVTGSGPPLDGPFDDAVQHDHLESQFAADFLQGLFDHRTEFLPLAIGVDHGVAEFGA